MSDPNDDLSTDGSVYSAYDEYNNRPASSGMFIDLVVRNLKS